MGTELGTGDGGRGTGVGYAPGEIMACVAARELRDGEVVFVGIGLPNVACNLARATHAPGLVLIYESGAIGAQPARLPVSIGDPSLVTGSLMLCGMADVFQLFLQNGRIEVGFLGGAQVDRWGNINTTVIGDYASPKVRLPGSGGAAEIAIHARRTLIIALCLGLMIVAISAAAVSAAVCTTVCYVDAATGNDANDGDTPATAKKTIQAAVNQVTAGGQVIVAAGVYIENVTISQSLTLTGAGQTDDAAGTVLDGSTLLDKGIYINAGVTDVTIENLRIEEELEFKDLTAVEELAAAASSPNRTL